MLHRKYHEIYNKLIAYVPTYCTEFQFPIQIAFAQNHMTTTISNCTKLCLLMHLVHNNRAPSYLADSVTATANLSGRTRLQSASSLRYEQPRTRLEFGECCFAFAGTAAWKSLPSSIQQLSDTECFKRHLKTVLF